MMEEINMGTAPTGADGDRVRQASAKINANFEEIWGLVQALTPEAQIVSPSSGDTVSMTDDSRDGLLNIILEGPILALTVNLPSNGNSRNSQIRRIATSHDIASFTLQGAGVIRGNLAALFQNDLVLFQKLGDDEWAKQN